MSVRPAFVHDTVAAFRTACDALRANGKSVGFVPTMGALHEGHLALVSEARRRADAVAVSIFVNPTQFGPNEDFARYPRSLERDSELCRDAGAALVFAPSSADMYPPGHATRVRVDELGRHLCGPFRPGHFEGVATVVTKLFAAVGPAIAVFGRKDYQQLKIIERLAVDLLLPVKVEGHPTVRDQDGLALSSRNAYLSQEERRRAQSLPRALGAAMRAHRAGERRAAVLERTARELVEPQVTSIDYVSLCDADRLEPLAGDALVPDRALLAVAAHVGTTRLIDNVVFGEDQEPGPS